jgi:hypothetical protein
MKYMKGKQNLNVYIRPTTKIINNRFCFCIFSRFLFFFFVCGYINTEEKKKEKKESMTHDRLLFYAQVDRPRSSLFFSFLIGK